MDLAGKEKCLHLGFEPQESDDSPACGTQNKTRGDVWERGVDAPALGGRGRNTLREGR